LLQQVKESGPRRRPLATLSKIHLGRTNQWGVDFTKTDGRTDTVRTETETKQKLRFESQNRLTVSNRPKDFSSSSSIYLFIFRRRFFMSSSSFFCGRQRERETEKMALFS
jgi:hypothetical protein